MQNNISALLARSGVRYLVVGGTVYAFELAVILLSQHLGAGSVLAVAISFVLGTLVSFGLQKLVTFGDRRMHHKVLVPQIAATMALIGFNFGFTVLFTKLFQTIIPAVLCRTIALAISTIWNYYLYRTKIFKTT